MIKPLAISGFFENLLSEQILEEKFKDIIKKNYLLSGFDLIETPIVERLEVLTSKGANDSEIYGIYRINGQVGDDRGLGLRFDLTVPLARYVAMYEGVLTFPFKRSQIAKVYRGERPQKGRYREFYQADIDIIGNSKLSLFADVEIISTIYNSLKDLNFGEFVININNKKLLSGFLSHLGIEKIIETIGIIDKKDKLKSIVPALQEIITNSQIDKLLEFIEKSIGKENIIQYLKSLGIENIEFLEGLEELEYVYNNLINLGLKKESLIINLSISRGLNYYTGTIFETFIIGGEKMGSIASGGRYENLASNFSKNNFPGVGGSIGLSRLISVLNNLGLIKADKKTLTQVMLVNMGDNLLKNNLEIIKFLRDNGIKCELYLDSNAKISKQIKYADNKKVPYVIIMGENELKKGVVLLKTLSTGKQEEIKIEDIISFIL